MAIMLHHYEAPQRPGCNVVNGHDKIFLWSRCIFIYHAQHEKPGCNVHIFFQIVWSNATIFLRRTWNEEWKLRVLPSFKSHWPRGLDNFIQGMSTVPFQFFSQCVLTHHAFFQVCIVRSRKTISFIFVCSDPDFSTTRNNALRNSKATLYTWAVHSPHGWFSALRTLNMALVDPARLGFWRISKEFSNKLRLYLLIFWDHKRLLRNLRKIEASDTHFSRHMLSIFIFCAFWSEFFLHKYACTRLI
jgi:hypothetical protein